MICLEWISVRDKLPPPHTTVIVFGMKKYAKKHSQVMAAWRNHEWQQREYGDAEWDGRHIGFDTCFRPLKNVTHWMPLPKAPNTQTVTVAKGRK